jgi:hypothetical protein
VSRGAQRVSDAAAPASLDGISVVRGALAPEESLEERIFSTVGTCLDAAGVRQRDVDAVVIAADDVADGRAITTMLHATAAGAYRRDELRITNGSLAALGLAALRVTGGLSERVLVVAWWLPTADPVAIARSGLDPSYGRLVADDSGWRESFTDGACAACLVRSGAGPDRLLLEGMAFGQADYHRWLARQDEPFAVLARVGAALDRRAPVGEGAALLGVAPGPAAAWTPLADAARMPPGRNVIVADGLGHAGGLGLLCQVARELVPGDRAVVAATGMPPFLAVEALAIARDADA